MNRYAYSFENNVLKIATIKYGIMAFPFDNGVCPPDYTEEQVEQYNLECAKRDAIRILISGDESKMHEFVNAIGDNPDTGYGTFVFNNGI